MAVLRSRFRVLTPDLIGFGCSDKPAAQSDYTYERHVAWKGEWLTGFDLTGITLHSSRRPLPPGGLPG